MYASVTNLLTSSRALAYDGQFKAIQHEKQIQKILRRDTLEILSRETEERYTGPILRGDTLERFSGENGEVLHRRSDAEVFGKKHRRLRNGQRDDFCTNQSDSAGSGIGEHLTSGQRGYLV